MKLKSGDVAPDFELPSSDGTTFKLKTYHDKKLVIFFYPRDATPGCTIESCRFRDKYEDFLELGTTVVGISSDSIESHKKFCRNHSLQYPVLSDSAGKVRKLYGASSVNGILPDRVTFLIDRKGIIHDVFSSQLQVLKHVDWALRWAKSTSN